ncbi:hypothetical protein J7J18_06860 [bacterium]|nr:hypothetical protein [bacterium]
MERQLEKKEKEQQVKERLVGETSITAGTFASLVTSLSASQLRQIYKETNVVRRCVDHIASSVADLPREYDVKFGLKKSEVIDLIFVRETITGETFRDVLIALTVDLLVLNKGVLVPLKTFGGRLTGFTARDAATFSPVYEKDGRLRGFIQQVGLGKVYKFRPDELVYIQLIPKTYTATGGSILESLTYEVTSLLKNLVKSDPESRKPIGTFIFPESLDEAVVNRFQEDLTSLVSGGKVKIPVVWGAGKGEWIELVKQFDIQMVATFLDRLDWLVRSAFGFVPPGSSLLQSRPNEDLMYSTLVPVVARAIQNRLNRFLKPYGVTFSFKIPPAHSLQRIIEGTKSGLISPNEARQFMYLPPVKGGDQLSVMQPQGLTPVGKSGQQSPVVPLSDAKQDTDITRSLSIEEVKQLRNLSLLSDEKVARFVLRRIKLLKSMQEELREAVLDYRSSFEEKVMLRQDTPALPSYVPFLLRVEGIIDNYEAQSIALGYERVLQFWNRREFDKDLIDAEIAEHDRRLRRESIRSWKERLDSIHNEAKRGEWDQVKKALDNFIRAIIAAAGFVTLFANLPLVLVSKFFEETQGVLLRWVGISDDVTCYDEATKVLTDRGWKFFKDLDGTERLLSINPDDLTQVEWLKPVAYQTFEYDGEMIHFEGYQTDLLVTPDHQCFVYDNGRLRKVRAGELTQFAKVSFYHGVPVDVADVSSISCSEAEVRLSYYKGKVYDVTLPKWHTLYIMRNGKCMWSGNCEDCAALQGRVFKPSTLELLQTWPGYGVRCGHNCRCALEPVSNITQASVNEWIGKVIKFRNLHVPLKEAALVYSDVIEHIDKKIAEALKKNPHLREPSYVALFKEIRLRETLTQPKYDAIRNILEIPASFTEEQIRSAFVDAVALNVLLRQNFQYPSSPFVSEIMSIMERARKVLWNEQLSKLLPSELKESWLEGDFAPFEKLSLKLFDIPVKAYFDPREFFTYMFRASIFSPHREDIVGMPAFRELLATHVWSPTTYENWLNRVYKARSAPWRATLTPDRVLTRLEYVDSEFRDRLVEILKSYPMLRVPSFWDGLKGIKLSDVSRYDASYSLEGTYDEFVKSFVGSILTTGDTFQFLHELGHHVFERHFTARSTLRDAFAYVYRERVLIPFYEQVLPYLTEKEAQKFMGYMNEMLDASEKRTLGSFFLGSRDVFREEIFKPIYPKLQEVMRNWALPMRLYSLQSIDESFAELFATYIRNPSVLYFSDPELYLFMESLLQNLAVRPETLISKHPMWKRVFEALSRIGLTRSQIKQLLPNLLWAHIREDVGFEELIALFESAATAEGEDLRKKIKDIVERFFKAPEKKKMPSSEPKPKEIRKPRKAPSLPEKTLVTLKDVREVLEKTLKLEGRDLEVFMDKIVSVVAEGKMSMIDVYEKLTSFKTKKEALKWLAGLKK